ncbi:MAG TPA: glycosyltransferase family 4 protein [Patescibacteria group bacterium]
MKIGFYSPYLDMLGGGERYIATIAQLLSGDHQVFFFWDNPKIIGDLSGRFGLNLTNVSTFHNVFKNNFIERITTLRSFDYLFYLSDGSIPSPLAKKTILHFQVPFVVKGRTIANKIKLSKIDSIICNSIFTKKIIDQSFGINSKVVYPPVDTEAFKPLTKENYILSVGRFFSHLHSKKQEVLIDAFGDLKIKGWKLVLAGGVDDKDYIEKLKKRAKGLKVEFKFNVSLEELKKLYGKAKIYWHAAGYGEDLQTHPERAEHFGISIAEAMSAGCVPVVFNGGGMPEVVEDKIDGFLFLHLGDLGKITRDLIENEELLNNFSKRAQLRSENFSTANFINSIKVFFK